MFEFTYKVTSLKASYLSIIFFFNKYRYNYTLKLKKAYILKIENPFESGHIKNYLLAYASVVVIMILFFIASTLFHDVKEIEKKEFEKKTPVKVINEDINDTQDTNKTTWKSGLKLMDKVY